VIYVVAATSAAYETWCKAQGLHLVNSTHKYVASYRVLVGLTRDVEFLFLPGWQQRSDWRQIYNKALAIGRRPS
jgi:hypothetical protein